MRDETLLFMMETQDTPHQICVRLLLLLLYQVMSYQMIAVPTKCLYNLLQSHHHHHPCYPPCQHDGRDTLLIQKML